MNAFCILLFLGACAAFILGIFQIAVWLHNGGHKRIPQAYNQFRQEERQ